MEFRQFRPSSTTWETTWKARNSSGNPVGLLDPSPVFYYDTVLDLTWLRNWNVGAGTSYDDGDEATDGKITWASAKAFATAVNFNGFTGWSLPQVLDTGAAGCAGEGYDGTDCGYNVYTNELVHRGSPLAHMFYDTLGNLSAFYANGSDRPTNEQGITWGLVNTGLFFNMQGTGQQQQGGYWSGTAYAPFPNEDAWFFEMSSGGQTNVGQPLDTYVVLVRPGDVYPGSAPEPGSLALLGVAIAGQAAERRRKQ